MLKRKKNVDQYTISKVPRNHSEQVVNDSKQEKRFSPESWRIKTLRKRNKIPNLTSIQTQAEDKLLNGS